MILFLILFQADSIQYSGNRILFFPESNSVKLFGKGEVIYGDLRVEAETISYFIDKKKLIANGNPIFYEKDQKITGDKMVYFFDEKKGVVNNGRTKVEKGWMTGKEVRFYKNKILKINKGTFTTCDLSPPHYYFFSPRMKVILNDKLMASNIFLVVSGIPLFYIPIWMYPLSRGRRSGFLMPKFGSSGYAGKYIENIAWYQTLGSNADATLGFNFYTSMGLRPFFELRWTLEGNKSRGNISGFYQRERGGRERWELKGNNNSQIPGGINMKFFSNLQSDRDINRDYIPGVVNPGTQNVESYLSLSRSFSFASGDVIFEWEKNLFTGEIKEKLPKFNVTIFPGHIGPVSIDFSTSSLRNEEDILYNNSRSNASITKNMFPFVVTGKFNVNNFYTSLTKDSIPRMIWNYSYSLQTHTKIYLFSLFGVYPFNKFRNVITPRFSYSYTSSADSVDFFPGAPFSIPHQRRSLIFSLTSDLQGKMGENKFELLTLGAASSYQFDEKKIAPIMINGKIPFNVITSNISTTYDIYTRKFSDIFLNTDFTLEKKFESKPFHFDIRHHLTFTDTSLTQQADAKLKMNITRKWFVELNSHYDFERGKMTNMSVALKRDLHCWSMSFSYSYYGSNWDYKFSLRLKSIPEIKLERTTIKSLFP